MHQAGGQSTAEARIERPARIRARASVRGLASAAAAALLLTACGHDPIRDADFSQAYELHLVAGDSLRTGGTRFHSKLASMEELEAWLQTQDKARQQIREVEAGIQHALLVVSAL